jgi:hypothetical protein
MLEPKTINIGSLIISNTVVNGHVLAYSHEFKQYLIVCIDDIVYNADIIDKDSPLYEFAKATIKHRTIKIVKPEPEPKLEMNEIVEATIPDNNLFKNFRSKEIKEAQKIDHKKMESLMRIKARTGFIPGKHYGLLVPIDYNNVLKMWKCVCDCGKTIHIKSSKLYPVSHHSTKSCGCIRTKQIKQIVEKEEWYIEYKDKYEAYHKSLS